jgi:uncharacterized tellurite resistance protein B-like protein
MTQQEIQTLKVIMSDFGIPESEFDNMIEMSKDFDHEEYKKQVEIDLGLVD